MHRHIQISPPNLVMISWLNCTNDCNNNILPQCAHLSSSSFHHIFTPSFACLHAAVGKIYTNWPYFICFMHCTLSAACGVCMHVYWFFCKYLLLWIFTGYIIYYSIGFFKDEDFFFKEIRCIHTISSHCKPVKFKPTLSWQISAFNGVKDLTLRLKNE